MAAQPMPRDPDRDARPGHDIETDAREARRERRLREVTQPESSPGRKWTLGSFFLALVALFLVPLIASLAGLWIGYEGWRRGDRLARWAMVANGVIAVASIVATIVYLA